MTTFGTMINRIAIELADPNTSLNTWEDQIKQAIVDAIAFYQSENFWFSDDKAVAADDITTTSVANQEYYDYPSVPNFALSVLVTLDSLRFADSSGDPYPLKEISWQEIEDKALPAATYTGEPYEYAKRGEKVRLYPVPGTAEADRTMYWSGRYKPTSVITTSVADSTTNAWMVEGAMLIRNHAKWDVAANHLMDLERAEIAMAAAQVALTQLKRENVRRKTTRRIKPWGPGC